MSKRTVYYSQPYIAPATAPTWNDHASQATDLAAKLKAASIAGLSLGTILLVFITGILLWFDAVSIRSLAIALSACATAGVLFASYLALRWSLTTIERPWQMEDKERARRWYLEDEERLIASMYRDDVAEQAAQKNAESMARIPTLALELLRRHYLGKRTSRAACVRDGICTAGDWNLVNGVFKFLGMKTGYSLAPGPDLVHAWATWEENVKIENDHLWIASATGWTLVE
jgi:hypothetical protein